MIPHSDNREREERLERFVHQTLRELPGRRAPRALEQRVLAEITRRAGLPWYRKDFAHWPVAARVGFMIVCAAFVVACIGAANLAITGSVWMMAGFDPAQFRLAFAPQLLWMENGLAVVHAITGFFEIIGRNIPPLWLYGGLALIATMYVTLVGLGAAAYKTLCVQR